MSRRVLRAAIATSLALALFVLVRPVRAASAPFCDDRGASAIASPPVLEALGDAIRRASIVSCDAEERLLDASLTPAQRAPVRGLVSVEPAIAAWRVSLARPLGQLLPVQRARVAPLPEGAGFRLERPPRS